VHGIVFDLDGTLVDSYRPIAASLNHAREHFGLHPLSADEIRRRVGRGLETLVADLVDPSQVDEGVRLFREKYGEIFAGQTTLLRGVARTLRGLHDAGYSMSIASNKPARFSVQILERLGIRPYFSAVLGPDNAASHKPDPSMIRGCLAGMGVAPSEAVYVGDMVLDVESAARAELPVILVVGGSSPPEDLARTGQAVLRSFSELLQVFPARKSG
jgi:phosphoglycolate phosphatase